MTTDVAKNFAWANEQFEHFITAWSQVAATRSDQASLYLELHDRITSRDGGYVRAMAILAVMKLAQKKGAQGVIRIHMTEDQIRDDVADKLAAVVWKARQELFGTEFSFLMVNLCEEEGIDIGGGERAA